MKLTILLIFFNYMNCFGQNYNWNLVTKSETYQFINNVIIKSNKGIKLDSKPTTFFYDSTQYTEIDSINLYGIEALLHKFNLPYDSLKYYISSKDIEFFKYQILHPNIKKWDKHELNKGVKVVHHFKLFSNKSFSIPLFSVDRKTIILCECGPCFSSIFHWNEVNKT